MTGIYKAYDVRGIYPVEVNASSVSMIGRQCAHIFESGKVIISQDGRYGGTELRQAFCDGLFEEGRRIGRDFELIQVPLSTTPMFYYLVSYYGATGGAMVTASHNPKEYNGIKALRREGDSVDFVSGTDIEAIKI
jgi:phosphomannomutase